MLTVILAVLTPVFQAYVPPPVAVKVLVVPAQMVLLPKRVTTGGAGSSKLRPQLEVAPRLSVTVTLYAPERAVIVELVAPFDHA